MKWPRALEEQEAEAVLDQFSDRVHVLTHAALLANSSTLSRPHTGLECLLLSIDLFLPNLVALGVQSKHEEYLKKLTWQGTSLLFLYRLIGWACISSLLLWVSLRWSY
jgi:hypothetical protein